MSRVQEREVKIVPTRTAIDPFVLASKTALQELVEFSISNHVSSTKNNLTYSDPPGNAQSTPLLTFQLRHPLTLSSPCIFISRCTSSMICTYHYSFWLKLSNPKFFCLIGAQDCNHFLTFPTYQLWLDDGMKATTYKETSRPYLYLPSLPLIARNWYVHPCCVNHRELNLDCKPKIENPCSSLAIFDTDTNFCEIT